MKDQLEAEQYFTVCLPALSCFASEYVEGCIWIGLCICVLIFVFKWNIFPCFQKLYKTQIRELKEENDEKGKLYKDAQQRLADLLEERCVCVFTIKKGCRDISKCLSFFF